MHSQALDIILAAPLYSWYGRRHREIVLQLNDVCAVSDSAGRPVSIRTVSHIVARDFP